MVVSCKFFEGLAKTTAQGKRLPELKQVTLPFPYDTLSEAEVHAHAIAFLPEILSGLLAPGVEQVRKSP